MDAAATDPSHRRSAVFSRSGLVAAFVLFLFLRTWGLHHGSPPITHHADERHYAQIAQQMKWSDLNPHRFENPPLLTYALFLAKRAHEIWMGPTITREWVMGGGLYLLARWISAILGTLTAFIVARTTWLLWRSRGAAIAACCIVGFSFLHGRDSHYGVNDVPMVFLLAASLHFAVRGHLDACFRPLVLSAALAGLAAAMKYNGAIACVLPAAALLLTQPRPAPGRIAGRLALLAAVAIGTFLAGNPYAVLAFDEFWSGFTNQYTDWGDQHIWGQSRAATPLLYLGAGRYLVGVLHLVAAAAGVVVALRGHARAALLLLALPVAYLAGMFTKVLFFQRFIFPLLPALACFAGLAWWRLATRLAPRSPRRAAILLASLLALACAEPLVQLVRHDVLLTRPSTWILARTWILNMVPRQEQLFLEGFPPRLADGYRVHLPRLHVDKLGSIRTEPDENGQRRRAIDAGGYLVTDSFLERGWQMEDPSKAAPRLAIYQRLRERLEPVYVVQPGPNGDPRPFVLDALYTPLQDLWSIERPGHTIRVWRIPPGRWSEIAGAEGE